MRIIHVEDYFDPTAAYQINELLIKSKNYNDEIILISTIDLSPFNKKYDSNQDEVFEIKFNIKIIRLKNFIKIGSRLIYFGLFKVIENLNPDVLFLHGIADFKDLLLFSKKRKYLVFRDSHMSEVASHNIFRNIFYFLYKFFFSYIINHSNKYNLIFALGFEEYDYLKKLGISDRKIRFLVHGYNKDFFSFNQKERDIIRKEFELNDDNIFILYTGKFNFFKRPDLILDIVNNTPIDSIRKKIFLLFIGSKNETYMKFFNNKLSNFKFLNFKVMDSIQFHLLHKFYSAADICIFPKETTLSSIHAQVCGCSVIMEKQKSNIERVFNKETLFSISDFNDATKVLVDIIVSKSYLKDKNLPLPKEILNREYDNIYKNLLEHIFSKDL